MNLVIAETSEVVCPGPVSGYASTVKTNRVVPEPDNFIPFVTFSYI